jgi:ferredoxin-NADP reductase
MCSMFNRIDRLLNRITMYRLALYYLIFLLGAAVILSLLGILAYNPINLLFSIGFLLATCTLTNWIFARTFGVPANTESSYISALILALIITPPQSFNDLGFLGWAAILAMASKYVVAVHRKHIFNPIAFAVALTYLTVDQSAGWWVGNAPMLPFVVTGGILVVRKIGRLDLVLVFLLTALATILAASLIGAQDMLGAAQKTIFYSPLLFFAFIILTEPLTTPPTHSLRIFYGILVGLLFAPQLHFGPLYITPELAILTGNIFAYIVSPKTSLTLRLKEKVQIAPDTYDFIFAPARKFAFAPGQYMEWTLEHDDVDSRGNRRYFTLASAPTEQHLRLGIKFYHASSTFKKALLSMEKGHEIVAAQLGGEFVLPRDARQSCVFIAGGIGITPFRSMIQYLLDTHQKRPITLLYATKTPNEIVYKDIFDRAEQELGIKTVYSVTDPRNLPPSWTGTVGRISPQLIKTMVPQYRSCIFYISGSRDMVDAFKDLLKGLGISNSHIKTDYFSGLA